MPLSQPGESGGPTTDTPYFAPMALDCSLIRWTIRCGEVGSLLLEHPLQSGRDGQAKDPHGSSERLAKGCDTSPGSHTRVPGGGSKVR